MDNNVQIKYTYPIKDFPLNKLGLTEELAMTEGLKYDQNKPRMELISPIALFELSKVLTFGAKKYADRNWENGFVWSRAIGAILRHTFQYLSGETNDKETGLSHMSHVLCEAMFLVHFEKTKPELDDRPKLNIECY